MRRSTQLSENLTRPIEAFLDGRRDVAESIAGKISVPRQKSRSAFRPPRCRRAPHKSFTAVPAPAQSRPDQAGADDRRRRTADGIGGSFFRPSSVLLLLAEPIEPHDLAAAGRFVG